MSTDGNGDRIERLLADARASLSPLQWQRVDALVSELVALYGRALTTLVDAVEPARRAALADDELLASLLLLHGLHPLDAAARVRRALESMAAQLGRLELVACGDGIAHVRALDAPAVADARGFIERVVQEAAPEIERVDVDGLREPAAKSPLLQIDLSRSRAGGE